MDEKNPWEKFLDSVEAMCQTIYSFVTDPIIQDYLDELNKTCKDDDVIEVYEVKKDLPASAEGEIQNG